MMAAFCKDERGRRMACCLQGAASHMLTCEVAVGKLFSKAPFLHSGTHWRQQGEG